MNTFSRGLPADLGAARRRAPSAVAAGSRPRLPMLTVRLASILVLFACLLPFPARGQAGDIELVESVPEETAFDAPDLRNTAEVWIDMIRGARSSIAIEQFYIANSAGRALEPVIREIENAAARGVSIRVLADAKFFKTYPETIERWKSIRSMECRNIDFTHVSKGAVQHAKFFVIDKEHVFLGSQNFDWRSLSHIREIGVRLRSRTLAAEYLRVFEMDWALAEKGDTATARGALSSPAASFPVELVFLSGQAGGADSSGKHRVLVTPVYSPGHFIPDPARWDEPALIRLIDGAQKTILLQVLSYAGSTTFALDHALRQADARGVKIRLLVSNWSLGKSRLPSLRSLQELPNTDVRFSAIPEHSDGFISFARVEHSKYLIVDGRHTWIGTSNWSKDYFHASRNIGLLVDGEAFASRLETFFTLSWDSRYSTSLDPGAEYAPPKTNDGSGK